MGAHIDMLNLAREVCKDYGIEYQEIHHTRGVQFGKIIGAMNDILLVSVLPLTKKQHAQADVIGKRQTLPEYLATLDKAQLVALVMAANEQIELYITRGYWRA